MLSNVCCNSLTVAKISTAVDTQSRILYKKLVQVDLYKKLASNFEENFLYKKLTE